MDKRNINRDTAGFGKFHYFQEPRAPNIPLCEGLCYRKRLRNWPREVRQMAAAPQANQNALACVQKFPERVLSGENPGFFGLV